MENTILVSSRGGAFAPYFLALSLGFCMNAPPHRGAFTVFQYKMTDAGVGGRARLELTEPLKWLTTLTKSCTS